MLKKKEKRKKDLSALENYKSVKHLNYIIKIYSYKLYYIK